jgi:hypothetical protein
MMPRVAMSSVGVVLMAMVMVNLMSGQQRVNAFQSRVFSCRTKPHEFSLPATLAPSLDGVGNSYKDDENGLAARIKIRLENDRQKIHCVPEEVVTIHDYKQKVADEKDKMVVVRFYAPWCSKWRMKT